MIRPEDITLRWHRRGEMLEARVIPGMHFQDFFTNKLDWIKPYETSEQVFDAAAATYKGHFDDPLGVAVQVWVAEEDKHHTCLLFGDTPAEPSGEEPQS